MEVGIIEFVLSRGGSIIFVLIFNIRKKGKVGEIGGVVFFVEFGFEGDVFGK